jgi:hypothetical protein
MTLETKAVLGLLGALVVACLVAIYMSLTNRIR